MYQISVEKLLDSLFDGVYFVDVNKRITFWNSAAERITGYNKPEVLGKCCSDNLLRHIDSDGCELCLVGCPLTATLHDGKAREANVYLHHALGHRVPVSVRISPVRDDAGEIIGAVEIFCDNSSSLQILNEFEQLKQVVYLDALTGVGNRRYGEMILSTRMYDLHTHKIAFGVLFLDIDHFKHFNDSYGHKTGDDVLVMVTKSISYSLRKMDIVARWGGEEFIVILPGATRVIIKSVSERIRILIENSFMLAGEDKVHVTVSIGATISRTDDTLEKIVNRADGLMYLSKSGGRNRVTEDEDQDLLEK
ncbi:MAG: sensor domain-containing diguanylate cyclase [Geobacteraceae bacterium]|nr:sensor domain-containing diguanylate cyclase [Geobacteraceae bacterium]NTW80964.1 sensor domain-containing diguanylate cyclase [Geobacteraceae bacterium]